MRTLKEVLDEGIKYLAYKNIDDGQVDAWHLFSHVINMKRAEYILHRDDKIKDSLYGEYMELIRARGNHRPLQYIIGHQDFLGLEIRVNEHVLIPRLDTEVLVDEIMKLSKGKDVLDLCTGSGCIIISLKRFGNINRAVGVDISKEALVLAKENANINNVDIDFIESDLFTKVEGKYDIIVSNPPYIAKEDIKTLSKEVRDHEPHLALDGKDDGLFYYKEIINKVKQYLKPKGYIFFEVGYDQAKRVKDLLAAKGIQEIELIKDLAGLDRIVKGRFPGN